MKSVKPFLLLILFVTFSNALANNKAIDNLLAATKAGNCTAVEKVLLQTKNPDISNKNGVTALMVACYKGHFDVSRLLIAKKAQVNLTTKANSDFNFGKLLSASSKTTALMLAAYAGNFELVAALIKAGASINAQDSDGQVALTYTILADQNWPHKPLSEQRKKIIALLLAHGASAHITDVHGLDPAYYYSCVAGLIPGFDNKFDYDVATATRDPLYVRMR